MLRPSIFISNKMKMKQGDREKEKKNNLTRLGAECT